MIWCYVAKDFSAVVAEVDEHYVEIETAGEEGVDGFGHTVGGCGAVVQVDVYALEVGDVWFEVEFDGGALFVRWAEGDVEGFGGVIDGLLEEA